MIEFAKVEDRDYYVKEDPVHRAFAKDLEELLAGVRVVEFDDGVY